MVRQESVTIIPNAWGPFLTKKMWHNELTFQDSFAGVVRLRRLVNVSLWH